jgi:hypothetical protein
MQGHEETSTQRLARPLLMSPRNMDLKQTFVPVAPQTEVEITIELCVCSLREHAGVMLIADELDELHFQPTLG